MANCHRCFDFRLKSLLCLLCLSATPVSLSATTAVDPSFPGKHQPVATPKSVDHDVTAVIHVGFIEGAEPYSWQTSEGILHGTVIYIFEEISKHLNYPNRVIYHSMPLNRATEKLIAGEIDVLLTAASEDLELHALPISKVTIAPIEAWTRRIQDCAPIEKAFQGKFATPYWFGELVKQFNATPYSVPAWGEFSENA